MSDVITLRLAVIGAGKVVQNLHLPAIAKSTRCSLVAVCDASSHVAERVADRYGVTRVYQSVREVLGDDTVEAVLIAVGDPLHIETAMMALEAGKHVLVEKPLGTSVAQCLPLRDKVRETGLKLQVGMMKRHDPGVEYAKDAVQHRIGPVESFSARYVASIDDLVDEDSIFLPVIRDPAYQRPDYKLNLQPYYLAGHGVHLFDQIRFVIGDPVWVQARLGRRGDTHSWHGLLGLASGAVGDFELTVYAQTDWSEGLRVFGSEGSVVVETPNPFFLRPSEVRLFESTEPGWRTQRFSEGDFYLRQLEAFAASVLEGKPIGADVQAGIAALEIVEAVARSVAQNGGEVRIGGS